MRWLREYTAAAMQLINFFFTAALQISMRTKSPVENSGSFAAGGSATKGSPAAKSISLDPDDSAAEGGSTANNSSGGSATKGGPAAINSSVAAGGSVAKGGPAAKSNSVAPGGSAADVGFTAKMGSSRPKWWLPGQYRILCIAILVLSGV